MTNIIFGFQISTTSNKVKQTERENKRTAVMKETKVS